MKENGAAVEVKKAADWSKITKNLTKSQVPETSENNTKNYDFPILMMENRTVEYQTPSSTDKAQQTDDLSTNGTPTPPPVGAATTDLSVVSMELEEQTMSTNDQNTGINANTSTVLNSKSWASLFGKKLEKVSSVESVITGAKSTVNEISCESATPPEKTAANLTMTINTFAEISARNLKLAQCVSNKSENVVENDEAAQNLGAFLQNYQLTHRGLPYQLRGLVNSGNWCYVNATLQALIACPPFVHLIRDLHSQLAARAASATPTLDALLENFHFLALH
uniref:Peptidase C19 ubiquitin carboxyl-terminal hydrolase domain-containing protein n=1 Tax=Romanomermis culicivorax TaxID=13658 RepID=A0A915HZD9_ROMCU